MYKVHAYTSNTYWISMLALHALRQAVIIVICDSFGFLSKNTVGLLRDELIASKHFSSVTLMLKSN